MILNISKELGHQKVNTSIIIEMNYSPVKREKQRAKKPSKFNEKTLYQDEFQPKEKLDKEETKDLFKGSSALKRGKIRDKTEYKDHYVPKKRDQDDGKLGGVDAHKSDNLRSKMAGKFDGNTTYKTNFHGHKPENYWDQNQFYQESSEC